MIREERKRELIAEVMNKFDFELVASWQCAVKGKKGLPQLIEDMKLEAERLLRYALEHDERESWWIYGEGLLAYIDESGRLALLFNPVRSRIIFKHKEDESKERV